MSKAKRVLMIGGPADGRWKMAEGREIIVADIPPVSPFASMADPVEMVGFRQIRYVVQACALFGYTLDVAVAEGEFQYNRDRETAIVRALFQRDVAEAMGAI